MSVHSLYNFTLANIFVLEYNYRKNIKEIAYLLDRAVGFEPHVCMSDGVKAELLEEAVQTSYEKADQQVFITWIYRLQLPFLFCTNLLIMIKTEVELC